MKHDTLFCWMFNKEEFENKDSDYKKTIEKSLIHAFEQLSNAKNPKLKNSEFMVWAGEYSTYYCLGIDADFQQETSEDFYKNEDEYLEQGFEEGGIGEFFNNYLEYSDFDYSTASVKLKPYYFYRNGKWAEQRVYYL